MFPSGYKEMSICVGLRVPLMIQQTQLGSTLIFFPGAGVQDTAGSGAGASKLGMFVQLCRHHFILSHFGRTQAMVLIFLFGSRRCPLSAKEHSCEAPTKAVLRFQCVIAFAAAVIMLQGESHKLETLYWRH